MLRLNKLFYYGTDPRSFDQVIEPTDHQRKTLQDARTLIRDHLRAKIRHATKAELQMDRMVEPRFRTQGSWRYKTCIQPAQAPQEMDWDFGVYLPVTVWTEKGPPHRMAKVYFDLVERALSDLCATHRWELNSSKDTCVRVKIAPWGHIDVPLYAAPIEKFEKIVELAKLEARKAFGQYSDSAAFDESFDETAAFWDEMDEIHLATRSGEWKPSDSDALAKWILDRFDEHGPQLRRVCRYLKAWRDFHWKAGGPSSVLLMVIAAQSFQPFERRDDLALEATAKKLAISLRGDVHEPGVDSGKENFNPLNGPERRVAADLAERLSSTLRTARHYATNSARQALVDLRGQLGLRISDDVELVDPDDGTEVVRQTPPTLVPPPVVGAVRSG
ncbi:CBASS cGAMP synthase [Dyella flagellata]|uniref:Cyclic GMP-AMP synthase n=1 Tax=Dyella flagellata TaxID=1867833 RepID=A0ABQ5X9Y0_9GAMM|nr:CBASS cGAMP synthase [Dyella flagellata]GLQ87707.1 hypothetical protein GCM10007898_12740 [Dyella flagellata]